jgi:hypothetical protein
MTLSVRVHVGGNYVAEVKVNDGPMVNVGPNAEKFVHVPHGRKSIIEIDERQATQEEINAANASKPAASN